MRNHFYIPRQKDKGGDNGKTIMTNAVQLNFVFNMMQIGPM